MASTSHIQIIERTKKHTGMIIRTVEPFNAGPPPDLLSSEWLTPTELFFVRNHGTVPEIDPDSYRLVIRGIIDPDSYRLDARGREGRPVTLSLDELRRAFPRRTVTAALQCAGNRRRELLAVHDIPNEVPWDLEAISQAEWAGASLKDVLENVGVAANQTHVAFTGLDEVERQGERFGFGASIPLAKALSPEVLLAYEMNGEPLTPLHGAPLRLVVPGYIGARSVKWLGEIALQSHPSTNYFQSVAYRHYPPEVDASAANVAEGVMLGELFVSAAICSPLNDEVVPGGYCTVHGYAIGHGGSPVEWVEVSADGGQTWSEARLRGEKRPWAWQLWETPVSLAAGWHVLIARAGDALGRSQPEDVRETWNFKGYMNNAWHRIQVRVEGRND